ncbi:MAG: hypothetical protein HN913_00425 [Candidatus Marinimicrobia bacterium]|jgi:hypothetical protein|nr:hypothetical protein [Candidatus Neomarinimicrobiota bacterium]MBT5356457.1 hypothetical protein [Candidatus Neomarinimicrobiota bacterium]MBT7184323.1 hypothetical protein [Candidatus Neomarinimicrobiota bacterium]
MSLMSNLDAKLLKPSENGENKEILIIAKKRRLYYPIQKEGLVYSVKGPVRIEFISRYPVLKNKRKSHAFSYKIIIDNRDTVQVSHRYKVQKSIKSIQHPKHRYTYSGNYFINIPEGEHIIALLPSGEDKYPVLSRVLVKEFERTGKDKNILMPMIHQSPIPLMIKGKELNYYECSKAIPLQIATIGPKTLKIMSRLSFNELMGQEDSYRIRVKNKSKVVGTFYFNTERSSETVISNQPELVPGKWRSCEIQVPKGKQIYTVELLDMKKSVLARFISY